MIEKIFSVLISLLIFLLFPSFVLANSSAFVSIVNPVRGDDFWDIKDQSVETAVLGQVEILKEINLTATFLFRFDALSNQKVIDAVNTLPQSASGLFLEVTPSWAKSSKVSYRQSDSWHFAGSAFLTGYEREEREKLIDAAFEKFKQVFNFYPKCVGAWWIDAYSLNYMQKRYGVSCALIVSDQYSTDNYQIWGQFWSTPYYPSETDALHPAQTKEAKLPVVVMQWAARDPVNGYGNGVFESTFSLQPNDYMDYHNLDINYFSNLIDLYAKQQFNDFSHLVVGLENSYDWQKYKDEYKRQMEILGQKNQKGQLSLVTMEDFATWYENAFPNLSPPHIIVADDPLGSGKKAVWFMNSYFRAGWFFNQEGSVFRDIRQYVEGEEELCFRSRCDEVNFATFSTRVLDEVTFGHKWVIDEGRISQFNVSKIGENYVITYKNEAGKLRTIEFLPRDISVDGKISSIDGAILDATQKQANQKEIYSKIESGTFAFSLGSVLFKAVTFIVFLSLGCLIPGYLLVNKIFKNKSIYQILFLSLVSGLVELTLIFYILSLLKIRFLIYPYILINLMVFLRLYLYEFKKISIPKIKIRFDLLIFLLIIAGTIFQIVPTFKNGLVYPYGLGFWGPNTHDGVWHISLINQLIKSVPPQNPIFAGQILKNYHYFYDLLVAASAYLTKIPVMDLVFRFYPILFSLSLGIGTYYLTLDLFQEKLGTLKTKIASLFSLYLVYFAGSFGWIVSYIKERQFGGESAFWANQSISFNLNPPFAISLVIIIALLQVLRVFKIQKTGIILAIILAGSLVGFKAYGAALILMSLLFVGLIKRKLNYLIIFTGSLFICALIFFSNFQISTALIIFAPFWFIHSMIDSQDRVGWVRLTLARTAGLEKGIWWKFITAEVVSLLIFIMGNLGMRFLSLLSLFRIKSIVKDNNLLFLLVFSTQAIMIPIFFIQSGNPWNTIQFFYYGLYVTALISGIVLLSVTEHLPKFLSAAVVVLFLVIAPINSLVTASYYLNDPHAKVNEKELEALQFLSRQDDGLVLTYPYDGKLKKRVAEPWPLFVYDSTAYVSALSNKAVYLEDEGQNQILLTDYKKRIVASKDFFRDVIPGLSSEESLQAAKNFLRYNRIKYIYLLNGFFLGFDEDKLPIEKIYQNQEVTIYQTKF